MSQNRRTCIVTHTGCDMTPAAADQLGIKIIPDIVMYDGHSYLNGYEIDAAEFYERLRSSRKLPTSSHPNTTMFADAFRQVSSNDYDEILCLTCTSKMSGTYSTASVSARMVQEEGFPIPIYVYDTLWVSHAMGLMVEEAKRLADEGYRAQQIMELLENMRPRVAMYIMMETLKYAYMGGRTGAIELMASQMIGIRPLLTFIDGLSQNLAILRNAREGFRNIAKRYQNEAAPGGGAIVFHGNNVHRAETLCNLIHAFDPEAKLRIEPVGPVIGVYGGPSSVGVAFVRRV